MDDLSFRVEQAADSILGDERLTAGLDDETADFLLDWGLELVTAAVTDTDGLDDEEAREILQPRIKATKRMLRYVNDWLQNCDEWDPIEKEDKLSKIFHIAGLAYGIDLENELVTDEEKSKAPGMDAFLGQAVGLEGNSTEKAKGLRELIEGNDRELTNG